MSLRRRRTSGGTSLRIAVVLGAAISVGVEPEGFAAVAPAWNFETDELEGSYGDRSSCSSAEGDVVVVASSNSAPAEVGVLRLSPRGEALLEPLVKLPAEAGVVQRAYSCRWVETGVVVLVRTSTVPLAAVWLAPDLSLLGWLALEREVTGLHPWAMDEVAAERFVVVGMDGLDAFALRFDRRTAEGVQLPWLEERERLLLDVGAGPEGGFSVCGPEAGPRGGTSLSADILLATFDDLGSLRAQTRLPGVVCRLLPSRSEQVRILHDDAVSTPPVLWLTTLDANLQAVEEAAVVTPFFFERTIPSFEMDGRLFVVSAAFAWETLEISGPSARESVDLNVKPGSVLRLLPGPSRAYVVSYTRYQKHGRRDRAGLRIEAIDVTGPDR